MNFWEKQKLKNWLTKKLSAKNELKTTDKSRWVGNLSNALLDLSACCHFWLCNSTYCSLPGSSVHGISQARILEQVVTSYSRGSSQPRDQMGISCASFIDDGFFTTVPPGKPLKWVNDQIYLRFYVPAIVLGIHYEWDRHKLIVTKLTAPRKIDNEQVWGRLKHFTTDLIGSHGFF